AACGGGGGGDTVGVCVPAASSAPGAASLMPKEVSTKIGNVGDAAVYADGNSFVPGDTIHFFGGTIDDGTIDETTLPKIWFEIRRVGDPLGGNDWIVGADLDAFAPQTVPENGWEDCCNWP